MIKLQIRSLDEGYQVIVTEDLKLLWNSPYIFDDKKEALEFVKNNYDKVVNDYERCCLFVPEKEK